MPSSLGRSLAMAASAPTGRVFARSAALFATRRPNRSYQGPAPMRSIALTCLPSPPSTALRNARHTLPFPGMLRSAMVEQILSAPRNPAPEPVSPKRRSPPNPLGLPDTACNALMLVTKKLNLVLDGEPAPAAPVAPEVPVLPAVLVVFPPPAAPVAPPTAALPAVELLAPALPVVAAPLAPVLALPAPALPTLPGAPAALAPAVPVPGEGTSESELPPQAGAPQKNNRPSGRRLIFTAFFMLSPRCVRRVTKSIIASRNIFNDRCGLGFHVETCARFGSRRPELPKCCKFGRPRTRRPRPGRCAFAFGPAVSTSLT